jgi:hypothetical protein
MCTPVADRAANTEIPPARAKIAPINPTVILATDTDEQHLPRLDNKETNLIASPVDDFHPVRILSFFVNDPLPGL